MCQWSAGGPCPDGLQVVQHGWRKKALYRDEDGKLHQHSALCTHLGCCVSYNPVERYGHCMRKPYFFMKCTGRHHHQALPSVGS